MRLDKIVASSSAGHSNRMILWFVREVAIVQLPTIVFAIVGTRMDLREFVKLRFAEKISCQIIIQTSAQGRVNAWAQTNANVMPHTLVTNASLPLVGELVQMTPQFAVIMVFALQKTLVSVI